MIPLILCPQIENSWLVASLTIAAVWWCTFFATQTIGAIEFILILFTTRAAAGYFFDITSQKRINLWQAISFFGLIGMVGVNFMLIYHNQKSESGGFWAACFGGIMSYLYGRMSYQFGKAAKLSATQILAVRFYILIAISICFVKPDSLVTAMTHDSLQLVLIALFSFIIPLYFNQRGIISAGPETHAIIVACTPLLMVVLMMLATLKLLWLPLLISIGLLLFALPQIIRMQ